MGSTYCNSESFSRSKVLHLLCDLLLTRTTGFRPCSLSSQSQSQVSVVDAVATKQCDKLPPSRTILFQRTVPGPGMTTWYRTTAALPGESSIVQAVPYHKLQVVSRESFCVVCRLRYSSPTTIPASRHTSCACFVPVLKLMHRIPKMHADDFSRVGSEQRTLYMHGRLPLVYSTLSLIV
jgi:hypothetical protein